MLRLPAQMTTGAKVLDIQTRVLHALLVFTMESLGEQSDRKRKMKFEAKELEL